VFEATGATELLSGERAGATVGGEAKRGASSRDGA
jgi:hypothetical protein